MATAAERVGAPSGAGGAAAAPAPADPLVPAPFAVRRRVRETHDTWTLELEPAGGAAAAFAFRPGQFTMLSAFGTGEVPISISGDAARPGVLVHTVRAVGLATAAICRAEPGDVLGVRGPFGTAWPVDAAAGGDALVIAGGIGLAPLRPVVDALAAARDRFDRAILLYGGRSPEQLLYADDIARWRAAGVAVHRTVDTAGRGWTEGVGVVPALLERVAFDPARAHAFVCGPEVMMEFASSALLAAGVAAERIHLSLERNMTCAVGHCGHCQLGPLFVCRDGPVVTRDRVDHLLRVREL
jgi:NAD(P)H-flavin reductase